VPAQKETAKFLENTTALLDSEPGGLRGVERLNNGRKKTLSGLFHFDSTNPSGTGLAIHAKSLHYAHFGTLKVKEEWATFNPKGVRGGVIEQGKKEFHVKNVEIPIRAMGSPRKIDSKNDWGIEKEVDKFYRDRY